jgi:ribosomal protein L20A (L18A)
LIEHILLRPEEIVQYRFNIFGNDGEIYLTSYYDGEQEAQKLLLEDVLYLGMDKDNYGIVVSDDRTQYKVVLYSSEHQQVALIEKIYYSRIGAEKEIERISEYIRKIQIGEINREEVMELIQSGGLGHQFPAQFGFSNEYSLILPDWPARFQNDDFRKLLVNILEENNPLHLKINLIFLDFQQMMRFEEAFQNWKQEKVNGERSPRSMDLLSLQLIQMLLKYPKYASV